MTFPDRSLYIPDSQILSVTKLTQKIKYILEENFPITWIIGEISNLRIPASGHAYFVLKDEKAQIAAIIFKGQLQQLKFKIKDGASIIGMGRVSVYEPRGTYQIILEYAAPQGLGALQIAFEQLKQKLFQEGLFDPATKLPLPYLPRRIGLITSPTGAVVHDLLKIIYARFANMTVEIYPVRVQGPCAEADIVCALSLANNRQTSDVLILARGGGSLEDLAAYNSEMVARAVFSSKIPIISAVGHETDFTIADFVADARAPTPSAAAQIVVPQKPELCTQIAELSFRSYQGIQREVTRYRRDITFLNRSLVHPVKKVQDMQIRVDDLTQRLYRAVRVILHDRLSRLNQKTYSLMRISPNQHILGLISRFEKIELRLHRALSDYMGVRKENLNHIQAKLAILNPTAILQKGYSITRTIPQHTIVASSEDVDQGQPLEIILAKGLLQVTVNEKSSFLKE